MSRSLKVNFSRTIYARVFQNSFFFFESLRNFRGIFVIYPRIFLLWKTLQSTLSSYLRLLIKTHPDITVLTSAVNTFSLEKWSGATESKPAPAVNTDSEKLIINT